MFARKITLHVKPNQTKEVTSRIEREILPILRKTNGFRDLIAMSRENDETVGISLWNTKEQLDAYDNDKETFAKVKSILEPFLTGQPELQTFEVSSSTSHKFANA